MSLRSVRLVLFATAALLLAPSVASAAWTVPPTPNVAGASSTSLIAVDCVSATSCMAVGNATFNAPGGTRATVAERWNGTSWQIVPTPNPSWATASWLDGVSCPSRNVCFAVGGSGSSSDSEPLAELWNGTRWSIQPSPNVPNGTFDAISCSALLACTAVGSVAVAGTGSLDSLAALAERWDGTGWHVQSTPNPAGSQDSLLAVSCPRRRTCTAVGRAASQGNNGPITSSPLVERWFGRVNSWGLQAAPKPDGADSVELNGVSCPNGPVCIAVGTSAPLPGDQTVMAERRVGSKWSLLPIPSPFPGSDLFAVSCPTTRACHATGRDAIAERFDGANWQLESIPKTAGLSPLTGVSCPSRFFCMAVGQIFGEIQFTGATLAAKWTP